MASLCLYTTIMLIPASCTNVRVLAFAYASGQYWIEIFSIFIFFNNIMTEKHLLPTVLLSHKTRYRRVICIWENGAGYILGVSFFLFRTYGRR